MPYFTDILMKYIIPATCVICGWFLAMAIDQLIERFVP